MKINATSIKKLLSVSLITALFMAGFSCSNGSNQNKGSEGGGGEPVPVVDMGAFEPGNTSVEMAANMAIGWNLGNTLDAIGDWTDSNGTFHSDLKGLETETGWGMPTTTEAMITAVHNAGFKTIRIPVSWHNHITDKTNYTIDSAWMARVKTVVDWAYNMGMCVIINIHHDNLKESQLAGNCGFALSYDTTLQNQSKAYIEKVWTQIATTFKDYDDKLVFEVLNEPRDVGGEVTGNEWWTTNKNIVSVITAYEQVGVNAIRAVSGNEDRFIMVPGYAATGSAKTILDLYTMPTDTATDRLILSTHAYSPNDFALNENGETTFDDNGKSDLDYIFGFLKSDYVSKGIGVVMGEASSTDRNNTAAREAWTTYYFTKAREAGIPVVLWDNMVTVSYKGYLGSGENHGYYDRNNNTWFFPSIINAMMKAVYGDNYTAE
uniref:Cellulase 5A n=1 Tax=Ruminococcus albus TaxID=1264 RepID=A0A7U3S446_RUMAL|nr:cellulase 5A [uncultured bacterium]